MSKVQGPIETAGELEELEELRPSYYDKDDTYEPWKVIDAWGLNRDFYAATALKHLNRYATLKKPGTTQVEELRKALTYVKAALERVNDAQGQDARITDARTYDGRTPSNRGEPYEPGPMVNDPRLGG